MKGTVKFFKEDRGFGFIVGEDRTETFVHVTGIADTEDTLILTRGMEIEYDIEEGRKGPIAVNVRIISK